MNTSVQSIKDKLAELEIEIKSCTDQKTLNELYIARKTLLDSLHTKKFKTRIADKFRKVKVEENLNEIQSKQTVKIVYQKVPVEIIKEVFVEVPVEVIVEKPTYVNTGDSIPEKLETKEFLSLLNNIRTNYIKAQTELKLNDIVNSSDGLGKIKVLHIDESEVNSPKGGIFAKIKRIRLADQKEGERFLGKDPRGYKVTELTKVDNKKKK